MEVPALPQSQVNWKYGLNNFVHEIKICPKTIRPLSTEGNKSWDKQAQETFGFSGKELFKGCKYIEEFILKYKKQPTKDEMAIFYFNRYVEGSKRLTLPHLTEQWTEELLRAYEPVFSEGFDMKKVVDTLKESR